MSLYADAAVRAALTIAAMKIPLTAAVLRSEWEKAVSHFSTSKNSIEKSCPRNAFIGLYMNGNILGIPATAGYAPAPNSNASRAISARNTLLASTPPVPFTDTIGLWRSVTTVRSHDGQMDVVAGLYNHIPRLLV